MERERSAAEAADEIEADRFIPELRRDPGRDEAAVTEDDIRVDRFPGPVDRAIIDSYVFQQRLAGSDRTRGAVRTPSLQEKDTVAAFVRSITRPDRVGAAGARVVADAVIAAYPDADGLFDAYQTAVDDTDLWSTVDEVARSDPSLTVGLEYEVPADPPLLLTDLADTGYRWYDDADTPLFSQENIPPTVELQTSPKPGVAAPVRELTDRLDMLEADPAAARHDLQADSSVTYTNSVNDTYQPGLHIHVDCTDTGRTTAYGIMAETVQHLPVLVFLSANAPGTYEGCDVLSTRQMDYLGGGKPGGNIRYRGDTIEYRFPDIHRDTEALEAITAATLGVHASAAADGAPRSSVPGGGAGQECVSPEQDRIDAYLAGEDLPDGRFDTLMEEVERGLDQAGVRPEDYRASIHQLYHEKAERAAAL